MAAWLAPAVEPRRRERGGKAHRGHRDGGEVPGDARKRGIRVAHAAYPPEGVADYTIMLMLMALRRARLVLTQAAGQNFSLEGKLGRTLASSTVGVVSTGAIGAFVIRQLAGFGCRILACDPLPKDDVRARATYVDLDTLLAESDVVTLHAPDLPENHHLIGAGELARMRPGAVLVNAARGSLVDTEALIAALETGHLGGAALDTIEHEADLYYLNRSLDVLPHRDRALLMALPNVIVSPHMAFYTAEDVENMIRSSVGALNAFCRGEDSPCPNRTDIYRFQQSLNVAMHVKRAKPQVDEAPLH